MEISQEFNRYVGHLSAGLGHADRHAGLSGHRTGLMLPLSTSRKPASVKRGKRMGTPLSFF